MKYNKGFAPLIVLLIVLGVLAVGGVAYFARKSSAPKNEVSNNYFPTTEQNYTPPQQVGCNSSSPSTIKVLSPNGGEVYQAGQQITVKWKNCNVTPNSIGIILIKHNPSIAYTQSEGQGDYAGFSSGNYSTADDGIEQITLPTSSNTNLISGQHYFVSVIGLGDATNIGSGYTPGDYSDGLFTINAPIVSNPCNNNSTPSITVLSPNGGETYTVGQNVTLSWTSCNVQNIWLGLGSGGKDFGEITYPNPVPASQGSYQWTATNPAQAFTGSGTNTYFIGFESQSPNVLVKSGNFTVHP